MDLGLRDRVAIVGGASEGIGLATATMLAAEGCRVVMAARREPTLRDAADAVRSKAIGDGQRVAAVPADLSLAADVERVIAEAVRAFGGIDIVVVNAGGPPFGRFEQHDDDAWQKAIDTNLMSAVRLVRGALPHLQKSDQARVITVTSTSVKEPIDGLILSNATRLAAVGLMKSLSRELGRYGITVNNVGPGTTMTGRIRPMIEAQAKAESRSFDEVRDERARRIPVGRIGEAEDVAAAIVFLVSAQARQISGQTLLVDGGATGSVM